MARERTGHTLQPTALVNEAWLRLVDHARAKAAEKRSGDWATARMWISRELTDE